MEGAVFVQTNAVHNEVIAYARDAAGMLAPAGTFATRGAGNDESHLPSQSGSFRGRAKQAPSAHERRRLESPAPVSASFQR